MSWEQEHLPRVLPAGWVERERGEDGASYKRGHLAVILSAAVEEDGRRWLHVSASRRDRVPSWEEMREVKDTFIGRDAYAVSVLPPRSLYVNIHPNVLHLFSCLDGHPLPEFTRGTGSL